MTFKQLKKYLQDNPNHYWFKRKLYGWGWVPATGKGWLVLAGFILFIIFQSVLLEFTPQRDSDVMLYVLTVIFSAIAVILICKIKGEPAGWKWGLSEEEKEKYK